MTDTPNELLNEISSFKRISSAQEGELVKDFRWLWDNIKEQQSSGESLRFGYAYTFVRKYCSVLSIRSKRMP